MMIKSQILLIVMVAINFSCNIHRAFRFNSYHSKYILKVPRGYEFKKSYDDNGNKEYYLVYRDSSVIYATDDRISGGSIHNEKVSKYSNDVYLKILMNDTIELSGVYKNLYWKEIKLNDVVFGYTKVPKEKKEMFDGILDDILKK